VCGCLRLTSKKVEIYQILKESKRTSRAVHHQHREWNLIYRHVEGVQLLRISINVLDHTGRSSRPEIHDSKKERIDR
jgi:hypothetical protein